MKKSKIVAIIQCTASDLFNSRDPDDYCISSLKASGIFDAITLAVPKIGDYQVFDDLSKHWGVDVYYGHNYNVVERLYNSSKKYMPDIVVRVLLKAFFIDLDLVQLMINKIKEGYDYVAVSNDVNYAVAADVVSFRALERAVMLLRKFPNDFKSNCLRFSPFVFIESSDKFRVYTLDYKEMWSVTHTKEVKNKLKILFADQENQQAIDVANPTSRYEFVSQFISSGDVVLDIACGKGGGCVILSKIAEKVYGIDYNEEYIENAKRTLANEKIHFLKGTDTSLDSMNILFDKIVCLHTLEHVEDDGLFLSRLHKRLKTNGKLILEVPKLLKYPLGEPLYPFHKKEYDRQDLEDLLKSTGFKIECAFGGNRNNYVDIEKAREVLFYVCTKN